MTTSARTNTVFINGQNVSLTPAQLIAEGGEAEIYRLSADLVLKYFKPHRVNAYQDKLRRLPAFPAAVVSPAQLCTDRQGAVLGYTMKFVDQAYHLRSLSSKDFRVKAGITESDVIDIFRDLHNAVSAVHSAGIVIGDFNPLNILVAQKTCRLLDADSMQFSGFYCDTFTPRYMDPLLCDKNAPQMMPQTPHTELTDWYTFALMFMESLQYVHPYGGVFKPALKQQYVSPDLRPLHRISILHPDVIYPKAATPLSELPTSVINFYENLLLHDKRVKFPLALFDELQSNSGRIAAPITPIPGSTQKQAGIRCRALFHTDGVLLTATIQEGKLRYLYHEQGRFYRENGKTVLTGKLDHALHFVLDGEQTLVTKLGQSFLIAADTTTSLPVELYRDTTPVMTSNGKARYWVAGGELWCNDGGANKHVDSVISKQTRIWTGANLGLGFAHFGTFARAFLFNRSTPRIPVTLPALSGSVIDAVCHFGDSVAWLILTVSEQKATKCVCFCINRHGSIIASAQADEHDDSWLKAGSGVCATTLKDDNGRDVEILFVDTPDGIAQIQCDASKLVLKKVYGIPAVVANPSQLLFSQDGLVAYDQHYIYLVTSN